MTISMNNLGIVDAALITPSSVAAVPDVATGDGK
jgi:hypothetical protein